MAFKLFVAIMALGIPIMVQGYSSGAPEGECSSMTPRHHVDPQKGAMPYYISFDKKQIKAGETVTVRISGQTDDDTIKGLLVQARVGDTPIGFFDPSPSSQYIQTLDCGSRGNAITHKKLEQGVHDVTFKWTAPRSLKERVNFVATIAKNGGVFWVAQKSDTLIVK